MNEPLLRDRLLRIVHEQPVIVDTMEDGLDILIRRLGGSASRPVVAAEVQKIVADGLAYEPVRLPPGALQCHWHLELTARGQHAANPASAS